MLQNLHLFMQNSYLINLIFTKIKNIYMSHGLLKGKKGIIFGALDPNSIAWITAERVFEEGGTFVLTNNSHSSYLLTSPT